MSIKFLTSLFIKRRSPSRRDAEKNAWKIAVLKNKVAAVIQLENPIKFAARPYKKEGYLDGQTVLIIPSGLQMFLGLIVVLSIICAPCLLF